MKNALMAIGIILFLNFIASAQIPGDASLLVQAGKMSATNFSGILSNTRPEVPYEFQYWQSRTNRISLGMVYGREATNWTTFDFRTTNVISDKRIHVRSWEDSDGNGIADWWELRYFGMVGIDPYGNPEGDGWVNMQKYQNSWDPFKWYRPGGPQGNLTFHQRSDIGHESPILTWQCLNGPIPDFFIIERADRTMRRMTNNLPPYRRMINGRMVTNQPPNVRLPYGRPGWPPQDAFITKPFEIVARVPGEPNIRDYHYTDTNVDAFPGPVYRIQAHYAEPTPFPEIRQASTEIVRKTILKVIAEKETNGYAVTVLCPALHVRYLLLVRDKNDRQWRASGYFISGTNGSPIRLHVDKKGMMFEGQSPIAMPAVNFLADVNQPEFTAGYGEDSDGDYLPDIYEVLVTHTDPADDDTGDSGTIDGFKKITSDGVSNLEKFRCRVDPLRPVRPPAPIELKHPTRKEIMDALIPQTDLSCGLQIVVRTNDSASYQLIERVPWMFAKVMDMRGANKSNDFDVRVSWYFSGDYLGDRSHRDLPGAYRAIEPLMEKINLELFNAFKADLETNPPRSALEMSNKMAEVMYSYREGGMDKGVTMAEMMLLTDCQPQDFYGRVIDQYGQPVAKAEVTASIQLAIGNGGTRKAQTDDDGLFQFTGISGESLSVVPNKQGYQIEGHGLGQKGKNGPETSPDHRAVYTMWKLKGPEPMIHGEILFRKLQPDNREFTVDLIQKKITEGTNVAGDFLIQIQRPPQIKPREKYDWSFVMTAIDGGFIEVTNDMYLNEAPTSGYLPRYEMDRYATNVLNYSTYQLYRTDRIFFLKSRGGQVYGHFQITELDPDYRGGLAAIRIEFFVNPSGSRNLEFDTAKQIP